MAEFTFRNFDQAIAPRACGELFKNESQRFCAKRWQPNVALCSDHKLVVRYGEMAVYLCTCHARSSAWTHACDAIYKVSIAHDYRRQVPNTGLLLQIKIQIRKHRRRYFFNEFWKENEKIRKPENYMAPRTRSSILRHYSSFKTPVTF